MSTAIFHSLLQPRWRTLTICLVTILSASISFFVVRTVAQRNQAGHTASGIGSNAIERAGSGTSASTLATWEKTWKQASRDPACPARNRRLEELLEQLARTDPHRAIEIAMAEPNWLLRDQLRNAALRGWGAVAPDAAADWSLARKSDAERMFCVQAVLTGAVERPEDAVRVGLRVCTADREPAGDYGHALINALIDRAGSFEMAARFATDAKMVDRQSYLLDSAYYQWSQHQPEQALSEFCRISDPKVRDAAMKGVIEGWADADAQKLADFAQNMPEGQDRSRFMGIALTEWVKKSPEAALEWMNKFDPHPDFDRGFATLALTPSLLENTPQSAIELTEFITDQAQRTLTRDNAFWRWALRDPEGARKYAESVQNPEYRESMLDDLSRLPKTP